MLNQFSFLKLSLSLIILGVSFPLYAQLSVSPLFSDHMVLQRNVENPIWGTAEAGTQIQIKMQGQMHNVLVGKDRKWKINLAPMKAGGPHTLSISNKKEKIEFKDILVGDVWICSGQSNMEWSVIASNNAKEEIENANDNQIRHFKIPHQFSLQPSDDFSGGPWQVCSPEVVGNFTAVGYYFAKHLRKTEGVPIGLLNTSWGGSKIEPWMSPESLGYLNAAESSETIGRKMEKATSDKKENIRALLGDLPLKEKGIVDGKAKWAESSHDVTDWKSMALPGAWEEKGLKDLDGIVWFRKTVKLSAAEAMENSHLNLGKIDDADISYINGIEIGKTNNYNTIRNYAIPDGILKAGENTIAVRISDYGWGGGMYSEASELYLQVGKKKTSLSGDWKYNVDKVTLDNGMDAIRTATLLYHKMIYPILGCGIKGAIWYQGESNAGSFEDSEKYAELFPTMIKDWRARWNMGDFPFLWVQLANWKATTENPAESEWAYLRESQSKTLSLANTGQAVIIDIGEADDIHPRNKQDVGKRLGLVAQKIAYKKDLVYSGPTYKSMSIEKNKIRLSFDHVGGGLMLKEGTDELYEFAIAGEDKEFVWAQAKIEGNEIVVWQDDIKKPIAVRYAWSDNPDKANLYNKEGLPTCPFRTDEFDQE